MVDVHEASALSAQLEQRSGTAHESPQLILFRGGTVAWSASHLDITSEALEAQLGKGT